MKAHSFLGFLAWCTSSRLYVWKINATSSREINDHFLLELPHGHVVGIRAQEPA